MSKRPPQIYLDEMPGQHSTVYRGRDLAGFIVIRSDEVLAYAPQGGLVGRYANSTAGIKDAREWLLSDQGERWMNSDREGRDG